MAPDTTIFQFLTYPNPTVDQGGHETEGKNKRLANTINRNYVNPVRVVEWTEMKDLRVFREVFGGKLFEEAHREGRELQRPRVRPQDCIVISRKQTNELLNKWNKEIIMEALDPILETYRPLIWAQGEGLDGVTLRAPQSHPRKTQVQSAQASGPKTRKYKRISLDRLNPDSGSIASYPDSPSEKGQEKFLKVYKLATKWKSHWMKERGVIDESGSWLGLNNSTSWPIKQAFTYCVKFLCRYGCIITCEEAFLFRVRPLDENPGSEDPELLRERLAENGLLEYVSVPWGNHCQSDPKGYNEWTMNLALWFLHVVAGNSSDVQWKYQDLKEETALPSKHLRLQDQALPPVEEVPSDNSENHAENSSPLSSDRSISPVREVSSKAPENESQNKSQSSNGKVSSDDIAPSDPEQSLDEKTQSDGTASPDIGAPTKRKRRREDPKDQISTEADDDEILTRCIPKRKKRSNLMAKPTTPPRADQ
ncbi:unnamed protein product [Clonostachys solani]|uniref:Uncharacterized protein n=1 Tax=Clonostachys solani TaxID=160281 RepID=A0A9N9ZKC3_9HYPO|nr:unnamed protein product [Clonostachys solani]